MTPGYLWKTRSGNSFPPNVFQEVGGVSPLEEATDLGVGGLPGRRPLVEELEMT